jgi:ethanolamine ammonia-lyase small subunit
MRLVIKSKNEESQKQLKKLGLTARLLLRSSGIKCKKISPTEVHMEYSKKQEAILKQVPHNKLQKYIKTQLTSMEITDKDFYIILVE